MPFELISSRLRLCVRAATVGESNRRPSEAGAAAGRSSESPDKKLLTHSESSQLKDQLQLRIPSGTDVQHMISHTA